MQISRCILCESLCIVFAPACLWLSGRVKGVTAKDAKGIHAKGAKKMVNADSGLHRLRDQEESWVS